MIVRRITCQPYASNSYILEDRSSEFVWLIDIGADITNFLPNNKYVKGIFITHTHIDHIQGINAILKQFPSCSIFTSKEGVKGLYDDKINLTYYHENPLCFIGGDVIILSDGDSVELFDNLSLRTISTPGHHPSCLSYAVDKYLFTGDSLIPNIQVVTKLKGGNKQQATESVKKIISVIIDNTIVCPGHTEQIHGRNLDKNFCFI